MQLQGPKSASPLACALRGERPTTLGEVFSFVSGLYFRGKLTYGLAFARPPRGLPGVLVITPDEGLRPWDDPMDLARLRRFAWLDIHEENPGFAEPLRRDARALAVAISGEVVLLGSVATSKYVSILGEALGPRLLFPSAFVGRGDMSRGSLLLRAARSGEELAYAPVLGTVRRGPRPPKLEAIRVERSGGSRRRRDEDC